MSATKTESSLNMSDWHTCETTHCRAGWVVHLAGEAGYKLEQQTSTEFAAMQIYKASSKIRVSPAKFYLDDNDSLRDMRRCAEIERSGK